MDFLENATASWTSRWLAKLAGGLPNGQGTGLVGWLVSRLANQPSATIRTAEDRPTSRRFTPKDIFQLFEM